MANLEHGASVAEREQVREVKKQSNSQHVETVISRIFSKHRSGPASPSFRYCRPEADERDGRGH